MVSSRFSLFSLFVSVLTITLTQARVLQFYIDPHQRSYTPTYAVQLVDGLIERIQQGSRLRSSVSLVYDGGYFILVDTPSATDLEAKELMLKGIASRNIVPGEIQFVLTTHPHPDHFGQLNFFPNARHFFGAYEYSDDNYMTTELNLNETMKLSNNVYLMNTPGHTAQDVSVIVLNTPCCGTVVVAGDLFYNETDALADSGDWFDEAWNPVEGRNNRYKILCMANFIIPGHGKLFRVTPGMRRNANCEAINATNSLLNILKQQAIDEQFQSINQVDQSITVPFHAYQNPPCTKSTNNNYQQSTYQTYATTTTLQTTTPLPSTLYDENSTPRVSIQWTDESPATPAARTDMTNVNNGNSGQITFSSFPSRQSLAPVIETAAQQLSKMLNLQLNLNQKDSKDVPFPHTKFWQDTISKISMGQMQGKLTTGVVGNVPGGLSQAVLSAQFNPNPFKNLNYLNAAFNVTQPKN